MAKLPKSIIRKYGITKKAWSVFRGKKSSRSRTVSTVRRKTRARGASMARYRKRSYRRSGGGITVKKVLIGAGVGMLAASFLGDSMITRGLGGWFVGGPVGAAAAVGVPMLLGQLGNNNTGGSW